MPGRDNTGPMGNGPMSGRGMGNCNRPATDQGTNQQQGRGLGRGQGRGLGQGGGQGRGLGQGAGQGRGLGRQNLTSSVDEKKQLQQQAENLQAELNSIKNRLSEMEK